MKKIIFAFAAILMSIFAQAQTARLTELDEMVKTDNQNFPLIIDLGRYGKSTMTKSYIEGDYYVFDTIIDDPTYFSILAGNQKVVKKNVYNGLKADPQIPYTAKLLMDCNKEIKYRYISKQNERHIVQVIITRKNLKNLVK